MKTTEQNIGMLRQWLNEDRITDPNKMVTNEQIKTWLNIKEDENNKQHTRGDKS